MSDNNAPQYKIVVSNRTKVKRITVGTPIRSVVVSNDADVDNLRGVNTDNAVDGSLLIYSDSSGEWEAGLTLRKQIVDGRVYPSDSDRTQILIRRSATQGDPTDLRTGELAYSYLTDSSTDGFGNGGDRLFIGVGPESDGVAQRFDIIGGKYFTDLLNHTQGVLTPASALLVDSASFIDRINVGILNISDSATVNKLTSTGDLDVQGVLTFDSAVSTGVTSLRQLNVSRSATFDSDVTIRRLTVLDSTTLDGLRVLGTSFFYDNLTLDGNLTVTGITTLDSVGLKRLDIDSDLFIRDISIDEYIDSAVADLIVGGDGITVTYSDDSDKLTIAATIADSDTLGVAKFGAWADSAQTIKQFSVSADGNVSIVALDGGFFGNDPSYPG